MEIYPKLNPANVILYSYRRPGQTSSALERICRWNSLKKVYVSIDGLRNNATDEEKSWREETIAVAEKAAQLDTRVEPVVWDVNQGLTAHAIRIMKKVFEMDYRVISLEEDNFIENDGLDFLTKFTEVKSSPSIATAFSTQGHVSSDRGFRLTYFPEQWATCLTQEVFESFDKVWTDKKISRSVVQKQLKKLYPINTIKHELVTERWYRIFNLAVNDLNYGDALMSYAALQLGIPYVAPVNSYVKDIGSEDPRGMHPRLSAYVTEKHEFKALSSRHPDICLDCENSTNQLPGMGIKHVAKYIARRIL